MLSQSQIVLSFRLSRCDLDRKKSKFERYLITSVPKFRSECLFDTLGAKETANRTRGAATLMQDIERHVAVERSSRHRDFEHAPSSRRLAPGLADKYRI